MPDLSNAVALVTPTAGTISSYAPSDYEMAKFRWNNGTVSLAICNPDGSNISVTGGSIFQLAGGTLNLGTVVTSVSANTITGGTINAATVVLNNGTINVGTVVNNGGTVDMLKAGTITTLPNIPGGTLTNLISGTINAATAVITTGTVRTDARTTQNIVTYGTQIGAAGAVAATIVGSTAIGAGTSMWVNDFSIVNPNGTALVILGFGTYAQGTNVLFRGVLGTQTAAGIEKSYAKLTNAGMTNQDLVLSLGAAGTVDLSISYLISL